MLFSIHLKRMDFGFHIWSQTTSKFSFNLSDEEKSTQAPEVRIV